MAIKLNSVVWFAMIETNVRSILHGVEYDIQKIPKYISKIKMISEFIFAVVSCFTKNARLKTHFNTECPTS